MKKYKEFKKKYIGESDGATLKMVGCGKNGWFYAKELNFGEDGAYYAYIVDEPAEIGEHYKLVATFYEILRIYDEFMPQLGITEFEAEKINVYRAGEFGCIIELIND